MPDEPRQAVTLHAEAHGERLDAAIRELDSVLAAGHLVAPDSAGMLDVDVAAATREEALAIVRDAIAAAGVDDQFTFPETTGTHYLPPSER